MTWVVRAAAILLTVHGATTASAQTVARVLIDAGWKNYQSQKYPAAEQLLDQAVREAAAFKHQPELAESRAKLAWMKFELNQQPAAVALANSALATTALNTKSGAEDAARAELILAKTAASADTALKHFDRAQKLLTPPNDPAPVQDEKLPGVHFAIAECHFDLGQYSKALAAASKLRLELDKGKDPVLQLRNLTIAARAALALDRTAGVHGQLKDLLDQDNGRKLPLRARLDALGALAESEYRQGKLDDSYQLLTQGREEFSRQASHAKRPVDQTQVAQLVLQQAQVRAAQGRLDEALIFAHWLVSLGNRIHPRLLAEGHAVSGEIHFAAGRFNAARSAFQPAKDGHAAISGMSHSLTLRARLGLAKSALLSGFQEQAADDLRNLIAASAGIREPGEPWLWLAQNHFFAGQSMTAVTLGGRAKELFEQSGADRSPAMLDLQRFLVLANLSAERLDLANRELEELVALLGRMQEESDLWTAKALHLRGLIELAGRQETDEGAVDQFRRSLEIWQRVPSSVEQPVSRPEFGHPDHADVFLALAIAEFADESRRESHWEIAHTMLSARLPDAAAVTRMVVLADFCRRYDRDFAAIWLYEKARTIAVRSLGGKHKLSQQIESELGSLLAQHAPATGGGNLLAPPPAARNPLLSTPPLAVPGPTRSPTPNCSPLRRQCTPRIWRCY